MKDPLDYWNRGEPEMKTIHLEQYKHPGYTDSYAVSGYTEQFQIGADYDGYMFALEWNPETQQWEDIEPGEYKLVITRKYKETE